MTTIFDFARQGDIGAIVNVLNSHPEKLEEVDVEENNTGDIFVTLISLITLISSYSI